MKVGFIGLGNMGAGMSRNLIKAGHDLMVYNRTRSRAEELQHLGAKVANRASEAAAGAEALITMLADDGAVQEVIFEPGRAIESLPAEAVHISISTISVALSRRLATAHAGGWIRKWWSMASWCESEARRHPRIQAEMLKLFDQIKRPAGRAA